MGSLPRFMPSPATAAGKRERGNIEREDGSLGEVKPAYRGTLTGDGRPGPIEKRVGRRLMRLIDPHSAEGLRLLDEARVEWLGPDGEPLGALTQREVLVRLERRLERRLRAGPRRADRRAIEDALAQVRERRERLTGDH